MCFVYFGSGDLVSVTDGVDSKCKAFFCFTPNKGGEQSSKDIEYKYRPPPVGSKDGCWKRQEFHPVHYNMRQLFINTKVRDKFSPAAF